MNYPELEKVVQVVNQLRDPENGCPWDLEQTHESLLRFLQEESYEFIYATQKQDDQQMKEELGDILLQVLLHSKIAQERNAFDLEEVSHTLAQKMIRRHPHVFDQESSQKITSSQVKEKWEEIKEQEKKNSSHKQEVINEEHLALPSLLSSVKIGKLSTKYNFDWESPSQVSYKVEEEWQELKEELMPTVHNQKQLEEELGDLLFSVCQLARHLKIDPDQALRKANFKFAKRFNHMLSSVEKQGYDAKDMSQEELDEYWKQTKIYFKES